MTRPAVIIGLGGTGQWVTTYVKKDLLEIGKGKLPESVRLLAFDTMPQATAETERAGGEKEVKVGTVKLETGIEFIHLGGNAFGLAKQVRDGKYPHIGSWFDADHYLRTLPPAAFNLAEGSGQIREFGRIAVFHDLTSPAASELWQRLYTAIQRAKQGVDQQTQLEVIIVGSLAGGTGAGMLVDIPLLLRAIASEAVGGNYIVRGFFVLPRAFPQVTGKKKDRMLARAFAAWRELDRFMIVDRDLGLRRMDYHGSYKAFQLDIEKRVYDVCYLIDSARSRNTLLNVEPEQGVFPSIADAISAILDSTAGQAYTQWVTSQLAESFNRHPGVPMYSAIGTYTLKVPIYYIVQEHSHNFALDVLERLLGTEKDDEGRVINLASPNRNRQAGIGKNGREEVLSFLRTPSLSRKGEETIHNTLFTANIADIVEQDGVHNVALQKRHAEGSLSSRRRGDEAYIWLSAMTKLGDSAEAKKLTDEIGRTLDLRLVAEVPSSRVYKDHPTRAVYRFAQRIPTFKRENYGIEMAAGEETRGRYGAALEECRDFQVERFRALLRLWTLNTLQSESDDPEISLGGKLGYAYDFFDGMVGAFDQFTLFMDKVKEMRHGELQLPRQAADMEVRREQQMKDIAGKKFLFFFTHPQAYSTQEAYLAAVQKSIDLRKDQLFHEVVVETARMMQDYCKQARRETGEWIERLATGEASKGIVGLYKAVANSLNRVRVTHQADQRLSQVQRLVADTSYQIDDQRVKEALGKIRWDVRLNDGRFPIDCTLDTPEQPQLGVNTAADMARLLDLAEVQFLYLPEQRRIGAVLLQEDGYKTSAELADKLNGQGEPLITSHAGAEAGELRTNIIRTHTRFDPAVEGFFAEAGGRLQELQETVNVQLVDSDDQHKCTMVRSDDMIRSQDFEMWHECRKKYEEEIEDAPEQAPLLHIFPAEVNAAEYERRLGRINLNWRTLHPKVVMVLENKERVKQFLQCLTYGFVSQTKDPRTDRSFWQLMLPEATEPLYLTVPGGKQDIFFVLNQYVLVGRDARPAMRIFIDFKAVDGTILDEQRRLGPVEAVNLLRSQIESGFVADMKAHYGSIVEEIRKTTGKDPEMEVVVEGKEYDDLGDLAHLMLLDLIDEVSR